MDIIIVRSGSVNPDPRVIKEAKSLHKQGNNIKIYCWGRDTAQQSFEQTADYTLYRFLFPAPLGKRIMFYLPIWWFSEFVWLLFNKWDVVHAIDYDTIIPAIIVGKLKHKKIVYDICDYYPDRGEIMKPIQKLLRLTDKLFMHIVNGVILIDDCKKDEIGHINQKNIVTVYNSPDEDSVINCSQLSYTPKGNFVIFYGGSFSKYRDIKSMISVVSEIPDSELIIAGYGDIYETIQIRDLCDKYNNTIFIGKIRHDELLEYTKIANVIYALYDPNVLNNRYASPTKMFDAMQCGTPIITNEGVAPATIIREANCGLIIPYGDIDALKEAVLFLMNNPKKSRDFGLNGKRKYIENYQWSAMETRLRYLYDHI